MATAIGSTLVGSIYAYWQQKWLDMTLEDVVTPLANPRFAIMGKIPSHQGSSVEFRYFDNWDTEKTSATNDRPVLYDQGSEPSAEQTFSPTLIEMPIRYIRSFITIRPQALDTERSDLMKRTFNQFTKLIKRYQHSVAVQNFVNATTDQGTSVMEDASNLPQGFKTLYAGQQESGEYSDLTSSSLHTLQDYIFARSLLENNDVEPFEDGNYACVIGPAVKNQLMQDPAFNDVVKRHESMAKTFFQRAIIPSFEGITWIMQSNAVSYRTALQPAGGALATRNQSGSVHYAHIFGRDAWGITDLVKSKGGTPNNPRFKVQDTSRTGIAVDIGFGVPYNTGVIVRQRGYNIAGTTNYGKAFADVA